jgi:hypothetical protein
VTYKLSPKDNDKKMCYAFSIARFCFIFTAAFQQVNKKPPDNPRENAQKGIGDQGGSREANSRQASLPARINEADAEPLPPKCSCRAICRLLRALARIVYEGRDLFRGFLTIYNNRFLNNFGRAI